MPDWSDKETEDALDRLADLLQQARDDSESVGILTGFDTIECRPGLPLHELLLSRGISRDSRLRIYGLLDKCERFDDDVDFVIDPEVYVNGEPVESYALALVLERLRERSAVGALALWPHCGDGAVEAEDAVGPGTLHIVCDSRTYAGFFRAVYSIEDVPEAAFLELASRAFPNLKFAQGVSFRRFAGSYADLRDAVVDHLSVINDRFVSVLEETVGAPEEIAARMGIDISIESAKTRSSEKLMQERDVQHNGRTYRCEWHSKIEPHRNRIHIHRGDVGTENCVLVGIFVDHLPT